MTKDRWTNKHTPGFPSHPHQDDLMPERSAPTAKHTLLSWEVDCDGRLWNGYDYDRQAWVKEGRYIRCGHPEAMKCSCYGRIHEGRASE